MFKTNQQTWKLNILHSNKIVIMSTNHFYQFELYK